MVKKYKNVIVAVSEGIRDKDGNYISATNAAADKFGHAQLSGAGKTLEYLVKESSASRFVPSKSMFCSVVPDIWQA